MEPNTVGARLTIMGTSWTVSVGEMLGRLTSMEPASAAADAAEISRIVGEAKSIADRLTQAFAGGEWTGAAELTGVAADSSTQAASALAGQVSSVASKLSGGHGSLSTAAGVLTSAVAMTPQVTALLATPINDASLAMSGVLQSAVATQLTGIYNSPMASSAHALTTVGATHAATMRGGATAGTDGGVVPTNGAPQNEPAPGVPGDTPGSGGVPTRAPGPETPGAGPNGPAGPSAGPGGGDAPPTSAPKSSPPAGPDLSGPPVASPQVPPSPMPVGVPRTVSPGTSPMPVGAVPGPVRPMVPGLAPLGRPVGPLSPVSDVRVSAGPKGVAGTGGLQGAGNGSGTGTGANPAASRQGAGPYAPTSRRNDDERSHRPADYLRSVTEGILVLGPQPLVGPPVIGGLESSDVIASPSDLVDDPDSDDPDDDQELDLTL